MFYKKSLFISFISITSFKFLANYGTYAIAKIKYQKVQKQRQKLLENLAAKKNDKY